MWKLREAIRANASAQAFAEIAVFLLAAYLAWVLVTSAAPKLTHPLAFASALSGYQFFPASAIAALTIVVPWVEVLIGAGLLLRGRDMWTGTASFSLMCAFTLVVGLAVLLEVDTACGCGLGCGIDDAERTTWAKVRKNFVCYIIPSALLVPLQWLLGKSNDSPR